MEKFNIKWRNFKQKYYGDRESKRNLSENIFVNNESNNKNLTLHKYLKAKVDFEKKKKMFEEE